MQFVWSLRRKYPSKIAEWMEYDGQIFSWGGDGLQPSRKKKLVYKSTANPVSFGLLIDELASGQESLI
jgi:hypothetical protein